MVEYSPIVVLLSPSWRINAQFPLRHHQHIPDTFSDRFSSHHWQRNGTPIKICARVICFCSVPFFVAHRLRSSPSSSYSALSALLSSETLCRTMRTAHCVSGRARWKLAENQIESNKTNGEEKSVG